MNPQHRSRRGQPLVLLGVLMLGWVTMRVILWQSPFDISSSRPALAASSNDEPVPAPRRGASAQGESDGQTPRTGRSNPRNDRLTGDRTAPFWPTLDQPLPAIAPAPLRQSLAAPPGDGERLSASMVVGHALLTTLGLAQMAIPPAMTAYFEIARRKAQRFALGQDQGRYQGQQQMLQQGAGVPSAARESETLVRNEPVAARLRRWTSDAWLLLREDSATPVLAGQPSYGRSQAGAVLRYRLAPSSRNQPQAYVRASGALESPRDVELAGGLSARPLAQVPVRLAAEVRLADTRAGTDIRPAAYAVTEFPRLDLPLGTRGEVYAQGGYVGGDFATAFVDGQARVVRDVVEAGGARFAAGAGAWGGAQKNASRLDVGPSAHVSFRLGEVNARLAVDYRVRVAGDAQPASGPALTLAAGF